MNFGLPHESWCYQLQHYQAIEHNGLGWEHLGDYRRLVERIAGSRFAERLFALRSLDNLVVSPTRGWVKKGPKFIDRSRIVLQPCLGAKVRLTLLTKCKGQPGKAQTVECLIEHAWDLLQPWLDRLLGEATDSNRGSASSE